MNTVNEALLRDVVAHIEADPASWDQEAYVSSPAPECGTTYCVAGWALKLSGRLREPLFDPDGALNYDGIIDPADDDGQEYGLGPFFHTAKEVLGLTSRQADLIFHWSPISDDPVDLLKRHLTRVTGVTFDGQ